MTDILIRINHRLDALGLNPERASTLAGLPRGAIRGISNGYKKNPHYAPSLRTIERLSVVLQSPVEWLMHGTGQECISEQKSLPNSGADIVKFPKVKSIDASETPKIPEVSTRGGLGAGGIQAFDPVVTENGITIGSDLIADTWGIPEAFLRVLRTTQGSLRIMEVQGDSGYDPARPDLPGSLLPGDKVFIDTSDRRPSPPGPFAVWDGIGVVVKWIEVFESAEDPMLILRSRNPSYSERTRHYGEVNILGRVRGRITLF
jgi:hypothetical protein